MAGGPCLQLLRPYAYWPLSTKSDVYGRFYSAAQSAYLTHNQHPQRLSSSTARCRGSDSVTLSAPDEVTPKDSAASKKAYVEVDEQKEFRDQKHRRIQKLKYSSSFQYPRFRYESSPATLTVSEFKKKYHDLPENILVHPDEVRLQGRVMTVRKSSSKLAFLDIQGDFKQVQAMLNFKDIQKSGSGREEFDHFMRPLLRGDFVSVVGTPMRTATGELTLKATRVPTMLSPSLTPIPEKLMNDETMVQNRSLDLLVNARSSDVLRLRSDLIWKMRNFFHGRNFMEVQTPILADYAGGATARPFLTSATEFPSKELALRIAPELWLKRLVVGGFERIFEIGPSFRNEGLDATHNPEFTMCEFYMAYIDLNGLMDFTTIMMRDLAVRCHAVVEQEYRTLQAPDPQYFTGEFKQIKFIPGLEEVLDIRIPPLEEPDALNQLTALLEAKGIEVKPGTTLNKLLDKLAARFIESESHSKPIYITHHPACMSPLSKSFICSDTNQLLSARAELFIKGREIANMYEEENDPSTQRRKFEQQVAARESGDQEAVEARVKVDESYVQALEQGLPPTGGWGCGIDRLVMLFSGANRISDTLSFGNLRNVISAAKD